MREFDEALGRITAARSPADLFGMADAEAARIYRALARHVHPDRVPPERAAEATAAFARLSTLWSARTGSLRTAAGTYRIGAYLGRDAIADYRAARSTRDCDGSTMDVLLKVARQPANNDLLRREAETLAQLRSVTPGRLHAYLPDLQDSFAHRDQSTGVEREVNVFAHPPGWVSLGAILDACPDGLPGRAVAWIWRRLLVALGIAHRAGVVHGAVVPDHVLIEPEQHGLVLSHWCYATAGGEPVPAIVRRYRDWYAPEIAARGRPTPGSDIYLATRVMTALLGHRAPEPLRAFARGCLLPAPAARPDDAWQLLAELDEVLGNLYGPRRFTPFALPAGVAAWPTTQP